MKKFKNILSTVCAVMVTAMFAGGVSAAETSTEATTAMTEEAANEAVSDADVITADEGWKTEIIHVADGEEIPDKWYLVPKEKMVIEGDYSYEKMLIENGHDDINLESLYAYIAISVKQEYLDKYDIDVSDFDLSSNTNLDDLDYMHMHMSGSIKMFDVFSYNLLVTDPYILKEEFSQNAELAETVVRAAYLFMRAAGYEDIFLKGGNTFFTMTDLSFDKITFSDEQLHYFDD